MPPITADTEGPAPRPSPEIFDDLRRLAQRDGSLHDISALVYRDFLLTFDLKEKRVADEPERRWSKTKVNKNELMLLLGLMVQSPSDRTFSVQTRESDFAARADELLREFHDRVLADAAVFDATSGEPHDGAESIGPLAREAIYYGAEGFYVHQFWRLARLRYRDDFEWLLQNAGLSIRTIVDIGRYIVDRINSQMTAAGHLRAQNVELGSGDLTNSLLVSKVALRTKFRDRADSFIARFCSSAVDGNVDFTDPFVLNALAVAPIVDLGEVLYVPSQYRLAEAIYESPFYWMIDDDSYVDAAASHRGAFLERTAAHTLRSVFGDANVYENVRLQRSEKEVAGEVDVLVVYGEFVIVLQAKSKRITLRARAGDEAALRDDFEGAIQHPYRQALSCIELIQGGAKCTTEAGATLTIPSMPRFFPMVVLSDSFPAATFLSRAMLDYGDDIAPVVWDLGVLDCVARLLPTPIDIIFYLQCRSRAFDTVISDSEHNYLGYHLQAKLTLPADVDLLYLDSDQATIVDDYMIAADLGIEVDRPRGILERVNIPVLSDLLADLRKAPPEIAGVVVELYDFSSAALENLSAEIVSIRAEVADGKAIKVVSVPTSNGGLSYAVVRTADQRALRAAQAIGAKHKYETRSDRWIVIVDSIETANSIDNLGLLMWPWKENETEAANAEVVKNIFASTRKAKVAPEQTNGSPDH